MQKAGQIFLLTFLNEFRFRIKLNLSERKKAGQKFLQTFPNEIRFRIKLNLSERKRQARNSFKRSSTKFDLESNWTFLNEKGRPFSWTKFQISLNENRFRIKLELSEWKSRPEIPTSLQIFLNGIRMRIKLKLSEWKSRPEIPKYLQTFLNGIWFRTKFKLSEWKRQARNSVYLFKTLTNLVTEVYITETVINKVFIQTSATSAMRIVSSLPETDVCNTWNVR